MILQNINNKYRLRALEPEDVEFMYACETDVDTFRNTDYIAPLSRRMLHDYALSYDADPFRAGQLRLVVEETSTKTPVALADLYNISTHDLSALIGIIVLPNYRRQNIATTAIKLLIEYCKFCLHLEIIAAFVDNINIPSLRLFKKCGFKSIANIPRWRKVDGERHDVTLFTLEL